MERTNALKVYKERQFLVFNLDNGKMVKYDFATHQAIGIKGLPVNNLNAQLKGYSIDDVIGGCVDKNYAFFSRLCETCQ